MEESSHIVEIEDNILPLANSVRELIRGLPPIPPSFCIYRVPFELRQGNEKAYTPQLVSIGPLHYGKKELQAMEEHKLRYLQKFLDRTNTNLEDWLRLVKEWEVQARNCYVEKSNLSSDDFVLMILLDSCFVIEAILRGSSNYEEEQIDYLSMPIMIINVLKDMILLENQLPFFILDGIYCRAFTDPTSEPFLKLSIRYFFHLMLIEGVEDTITNAMGHITSGFKVNHFLDLLRICHLPSNIRLQQANIVNFISTPTALEILHTGIRIKRGSSNCLLDIKYSSGLMEVPRIKVDDYSQYVLKNLIALEHCHYPFDSYIIDYVYFMHMLIDSSDGADLLVRSGIMENSLSENSGMEQWASLDGEALLPGLDGPGFESHLMNQRKKNSGVVALFNNLQTKTTLLGSNYFFYKISKDLNAHCSDPRRRLKGDLKSVYFSKPWRLFYFLITVVLVIVLTIIQTVCSIISLHNRKLV